MSASCFISPNGDVHPCITDDRVAGNLRRENYDLRRVFASPEADRLRAAIAEGDCPHCWTPCEAYPTILASALGRRRAATVTG